MEASFLLKGIIIGFSIAAPVGPIGLLCIRKTLQFGRASGLASGLGAAVADGFYGTIGAFGLTAISNFLISGQFWLRLIGGLFLIYLGVRTFLAKPTTKSVDVSHKTLINDFISTLFLTLTNPLTILSFLAIFAGIGLAELEKTYSDAIKLSLGVFLGASIWWVILAEVVTFFRKRVTQKVMVWINRSAGFLIASFGIAALISLWL